MWPLEPRADLGEIVVVWPNLPEHIKVAPRTVVSSAGR